MRNETGQSVGRRRGVVLEDAIRRAALRELVERGFAGCTVEGIARRAGTGKASLYRRWPTRSNLIADLMTHVAARWAAFLAESVPVTDLSTGEALVRWVGDITSFLDSDDGSALRHLLLASAAGSALAQFVEAEIRRPYLATFERLVARGACRPITDDPDTIGMAADVVLLSVLDGGRLATTPTETLIRTILGPAMAAADSCDRCNTCCCGDGSSVQ